jgi:transposase-like protein
MTVEKCTTEYDILHGLEEDEHGGLGAVIQLSQKQNMILMYVREGKSKREIARITGCNRRTVSKYMDEYIRNKEALMHAGPEQDAAILIEEIVKKPTYHGGDRKKRKLTPEMMKTIEQHLEENEMKRLKGQHKQLKKAVDIHEALCSEGADISYSTIRTIVSELSQKKREAFIKCEYQPGDVCEFDWGTVRLTIGGEFRECQMAVFTSAYGNYRYAVLFQKQKTEYFQEAHALFFAHVGKVYRTMVYDNMRVAVK